MIAVLLGFDKVGWIFSHYKRDYLFAAHEVITAAQFQHEAISRNPERGKSFVTLKLTVNDEGQSQFESFQVSDQLVKLYAKGFVDGFDPKEPNFVKTKEKVMHQTEKSGRQETNKLDTGVLIVNVPLVQSKANLSSVFPIENRPERPPDLRKYLMDKKTRPWIEQISDFHFLLFVSNYLDMKSDIPVLCESVKSGTTGRSADFKILIESYAGI